MEDVTRSFLLNERSSGLLVVLIPLQPFFSSVMFVNHIKESAWINVVR